MTEQPVPMICPLAGRRVLVACHRGMVGGIMRWRPSIALDDGLRETCAWFIADQADKDADS